MIGVDLTPEMVAWVTENARKMGAANVTFLLGDIEALPFSNTSVDVVLSNCVINLAPNKSQALLRGVSGAPTWRSAGGNGVGVAERLASRVGKGSASLCPVLDRCDFGLAAIRAAGFVLEHVGCSVGMGPIGSLWVRARRPL